MLQLVSKCLVYGVVVTKFGQEYHINTGVLLATRRGWWVPPAKNANFPKVPSHCGKVLAKSTYLPLEKHPFSVSAVFKVNQKIIIRVDLVVLQDAELKFKCFKT